MLTQVFDGSAVDGRCAERLLSTANGLAEEWAGKVVGMAARRVYLLLVLMALGCGGQAAQGEKTAAVPAEAATGTADKPAPRIETDTQLKINQEALFRGGTEEIRLDAARIMLFSDSPGAREILIDAVGQSENRQARVAVCRALTASGQDVRPVKGKKDFVGPLLEVLRTEEPATARFAAEAALIFEYDEIADPLESMAKDGTLPAKARLNAIYALKVQLDVRAIACLVELVDDRDSRVSDAAGEALRSMGIPVGADARSRAQILRELRTKGMERFRRDWLVRQDARAGELEKERDFWRKLYLGALDRIYEQLGDEGQRGKFLTEQLAGPEAMIRLWALDKVSQWRIGTQSKLPVELGPVLMKVISDGDRDVRLAAARLVSLTGELSSPERLAEQLNREADEEVKLELFVALGAACHYALIPTSGIQLSPELRKQTLEWAGRYLYEQNVKRAQRGAEVIRKLLEPGGLPGEEAGKYLDMLVERYSWEEGTSVGTLRGEFLETMSRLCGQSAYKAESAKRFAALFEQGLRDETDLVREAAVEGLINIDKAKALKLLAKDYANDRSAVVRNRVIELAGEAGGKDDLVWLWEKVGSNAESKAAWQAMLKIFGGSGVEVINTWLERFESQADKGRLADEQWVAFLEVAERRAVSENATAATKAVRERLAQFYNKSGQYEQAAEYLGKLWEGADAAEQKDALSVQLLGVYLRWPKVEAAARLVGNCLLEKDLGADSPVVRTLEAFYAGPVGAADPNAVLAALRGIKAGEARPMWQDQMERWARQLDPNRNAEGAGVRQEGGNGPGGE